MPDPTLKAVSYKYDCVNALQRLIRLEERTVTNYNLGSYDYNRVYVLHNYVIVYMYYIIM